MRLFKKIITAVLSVCCLVGATACGGGDDSSSIQTEANFEYNDYLGTGYNKEMFYQNHGLVQAADPSVITVGDTFYMYATNANEEGDCSYIQGWQSKNLSDWTPMGNVFVPKRDSWAVHSLWAPEVIKKGDTYYMYYSGYNIATGKMGIGLATSSSPNGPFKEIEGTYGGKTYSHTKMPIDLGFKAIDASPFIDDDGKIYLYVSKDQVDRVSSVYACELEEDMVTIKAGTVTQTALVTPSQDWENPYASSKWNEAPFMLKKDGKYYLFYSANYYQNSAYAIGVAVSDNPLTGFTKVDYNPVLEAFPDWNFVSGTGHCSVFKSPDGSEYWMAYHSHIDTVNGGDERSIKFDKLVFDEDRIFVNGPSIAPQLLPSGCSEYGNIASLATLTSSDGGDASLLTDGVINYYYDTVDAYEYVTEEKTTFTFTFDEATDVYAVMVYDSADYYCAGKSVDISLGENSVSGLKFNPKYCYVDEYGWDIKVPGTAAIVEFSVISTNTVKVTLDESIGVTEIVIVGKTGGNV